MRMRSAYAALRNFWISRRNDNQLNISTTLSFHADTPWLKRESGVSGLKMSVPSFLLNQDNTMRFKKRKARFSFSEVHILLDEVRKNRHILVGKFNTGVPSDVKRRKWSEITSRVNEIGECDREIMEVIKKWSDLKCDTKRKVAALHSGGFSNQLRLTTELSPIELIVESILELDKRPWEASRRGRSRSHSDDQEVGGEDEEEEDGAFMAMSSVHSSPGRGAAADGSSAGDPESRLVDSEEEQRNLIPSSSAASVANSYFEENGNTPGSNIGQISSSGSSSAQIAPPPSGAEPGCLREQLAHSANLSVQEQHTTNSHLSTVSRSLELLAESVQRLVETQQEFARESLQLQRETVQVLREFASGALTILHEKVNGKPSVI